MAAFQASGFTSRNNVGESRFGHMDNGGGAILDAESVLPAFFGVDTQQSHGLSLLLLLVYLARN
jgi:hypothetical protein